MHSKKTSTLKTFKKLADFAEYAEANGRLGELQHTVSELQHTVSELESLFDGDDEGGNVRAQAAELVSGAAAVAIAKPDTRRELSEAKQRLAVTAEAGKIQGEAVRTVTRACQTEMAAERKPAHAKTVQRIDDALTKLETAITSEREFRETATTDGCARHDLPIISLPGKFGWQRGESWEMFREWRIKMAKLGYIEFNGRT